MKEEEKKKQPSPGEKRNRAQVGGNTTEGGSTPETIVTGDTTGWDEPAEYGFKPPERVEPEYDLSKGFWTAIQPEEPAFDEARAQRLNRLARVNAFGDFVKHLGAFSGGGYAPAQKREENKGALRGFAGLDKMREVYDARSDNYNDKMANWLMAARNSELRKQDMDENRKRQIALQNSGIESASFPRQPDGNNPQPPNPGSSLQEIFGSGGGGVSAEDNPFGDLFK